MFFEKNIRTKSSMLVIVSVFIFGMSASTDAQAQKNYNSSKSNTSSVSGTLDADTSTAKKALKLDRAGASTPPKGSGDPLKGLNVNGCKDCPKRKTIPCPFGCWMKPLRSGINQLLPSNLLWCTWAGNIMQQEMTMRDLCTAVFASKKTRFLNFC